MPRACVRLALQVRVVRRQVPRSAVLERLLLPRADRHVERLATRPAMSACTWNTSVSEASNGCCHLASAVATLDQLGAHLHPAGAALAFAQRTLPVSR